VLAGMVGPNTAAMPTGVFDDMAAADLAEQMTRIVPRSRAGSDSRLTDGHTSGTLSGPDPRDSPSWP
jgi:hypothetical protein